MEMGGGGGRIHILWVSASNNVDHDQTPSKTRQIWVYTNTQGSGMALELFSKLRDRYFGRVPIIGHFNTLKVIKLA